MNFVRDLAIPIILLLAVGAIITSVNLQLTNLLMLGGQNDILVIRNTQTPIQNSIIPSSLITDINNSNINSIVPVLYQTMEVAINESSQLKTSTIQVVSVDINNINEILPFQSLTYNQLNNITGTNVIIGSEVINDLNLSSGSINSSSIIISSSNVTLYPKFVMNAPDLFINAIIINMSSTKLLNQSYDGSYYSELFLKVKDRTKIITTANQIQEKIDADYHYCNCRIMQGTGTYLLLSNVLSKIVEQLSIFNLILDIIICIRIIQSLLWIASEFQYELNELKILGSSIAQIFIVFMIIALVIENLGFILGFIGTLFIPTIVTYLVSIFTLQPATIIPPTLDLVVANFFEINILTVAVASIPAYIFASKKILKQKERE